MLTVRKTRKHAIRAWFSRRRHPRLIGASATSIFVLGIATVIFFITKAAAGDLILTPNYGPTTGGTTVVLTKDTSGPNWSNQYIDFPYTGNIQSFTAPVTGAYKLETWGAQGGGSATEIGGKGGYTTTTYHMTAGTTIYIVVGGQGTIGQGPAAAGYNDGGAGTPNAPSYGGGGATHISLATGLMGTYTGATRSNLLAVAGGGGGGMLTGTIAGCIGGAGGGLTGGAGNRCSPTGSGNADPGGGTQSAGGGGGQNGAQGGAGVGGAATQQGGSLYGGGGGGGLYGGGSGSGRGATGGGGSSYAPGIASGASFAGSPAVNATTSPGTILTGSSSTIIGTSAMPDPSALVGSGTTMVGRAGDGFARITILAEGIYYKPKVFMDGTEINPANVSFIPTNTSVGERGSITIITPPHVAGYGNVTVDFDPTKSGQFYYWVPATSYTNQCTTNGSNWVTFANIYTPSSPLFGTTAYNGPTQCRIVLNNSFDGTITLSDDYYDTIDPGLSGVFASSDPRFDSGDNTITFSRGDTLDSTGQTFYYTYTPPSWSTLLGFWTPSNQDDLMWPAIETEATPTNPAQPIALAGDGLFFGILAESYKIIPISSRFCEDCTSTLNVTTYGATYNGTITLSEDLSNSDNSSGTAGSFDPTTLYFAGNNGDDLTFNYTPRTTSPAPKWTTISGTSAGPVIADDSINVNVTPAAMRITGPTLLSRGETGSYTLTVYISSFTGTVDLSDLLGSGSGSAAGTFTDTSASNGSPGGTFNPSTGIYTFTSCSGSTCVRTFDYTVSTTTTTTTTILLNAEDTNDSDNFAFLYVNLRADNINFRCGASSPNCTIAYVGEPQDYTIAPNGTFLGSVIITSPDALSSFPLGYTAAWSSTSSPVGISYTPGTPGRYILSAAATSTDANMNGKTFYSNSATSLNDYIWVMANETSFFTGDDTIPNAGSGYFTLALNGPFIGTVLLADTDTVNGALQGGSWSNGGSCTFSLLDYDPVTNTTSCTFSYTPTIQAENRVITIAPVFPPEFSRPMAITPRNVLVYGFPDATDISPEEGPSTGGTAIFLSGTNMLGVQFITLDGLACQNLSIVDDTLVRCVTPPHAAGTVDVLINGLTPETPLQFTYFDMATDYTNECDEDGNGTWTTTPYVIPGTTINCRIILDGRWQGTVSLSDDYYSTIDPGLSGAFASIDPRFSSLTDSFGLTTINTADPADLVLEYTYTSPTWNTLLPFWASDGSNEDNLWWPLLEVEVDNDAGHILSSTADEVVFGLLAQEFFIELNGTYSFFCINCESAFIISTYGAPYEGVITLEDDLTNSDNASGTPGIFGAEGIFGNNVIDFAGSDGAITGFGYVPKTTATSGNFIRICGVSSDPAINDSNGCIDIMPVIDSSISITPSPGSTSLGRGEVGIYTLSVTIGPSWSGTVTLSDTFNVGGAGGGVFADISGGGDGNPSGTFNGTDTFTFTAGSGETYERTFTYTLRDDSVTGPQFPSYIMRLNAESSSPVNQSFTNVYINANSIMIQCSLSFPNCTTGYVGVVQDYVFMPNGMMIGSANVSASDAGALGTASWSAAAPFSMSYRPTTPGRQVLTATVATSIDSSLIGKSFVSTAADSLNDYIWVMANQMTITGPSYLKYAATGTFTLTMNGPFVGTIDIDDDSMGGVFAPNDYCTFTLLDYDPSTNTTSCTFYYTPPLSDDLEWIDLTPSISGYTGPMTANPHVVLAFGRPIITEISPESGPTTGGTVVTMTGDNLTTGTGGSLNIDRIIVDNIEIDLASVVAIDMNNIEVIMPPNAAGPVDIVVIVGARTYHHPDIYTYIPILSSISPNIGPTTGGTGFGSSYNVNGTVTITGTDITSAPRYSDGSQQYFGLGYIEFNGSQYINTGTNQVGNTTMTIDMTRDSGLYAAGVLVAPNDYFMLTVPDSGLYLPTGNYGNSSATAGGALNPGDRIRATLDANGVTATLSVSINGGAINTNGIAPSTAPSVPYPIFLGRINNGAGSTAGIVGKVYSFSINKDGTADDRNFVPVCTMDGLTGGMFDTLHNVFYPSNSGTPFTCDLTSIAPPTVLFGGTPASKVTVVDLNTIVVVPPVHAEGLVDVDVVIRGLTTTLTDAYTYRMPLTIFTVSPPMGSTAGGETITITGKSFIPLAGSPVYTITLDIAGTGADCENIDVIDDETITCDTTAYDPGLVSVTVDNTIEDFTMAAIPDGGGTMPILDSQGRSVGGYLYTEDLFIEITTSADSVDLEISMSAPYDNGYVTTFVETNSPGGFTLYMVSGGANLICSQNSGLTIPSTASPTGNSLSYGTWGYQIGTSVNTNAWRSAPLSQTTINSSGSPTSSPIETQVNFAARNGQSSSLAPCDSYTQTITYSAVAN